LQRHTFELLVKEVLVGALEMRTQTHVLDELLGKDGPGPVKSEDMEKAYTTHKFEDLFRPLVDNLQALAFPSLPAEFGQAKQLFVGVDDDRPDRLRYDVQFDRKTKTKTRSFPRTDGPLPTKCAPCNEIAVLLTAITSARARQLDCHVNGRAVTEASALDEFYYHYWGARRDSEYELESRLKELVDATKRRDISWQDTHLAREEAVKHPVFEKRAEYFNETFLEADYSNRTLILAVPKEIVPRGKVLLEDEFYLAMRRADGTLSEGVWFCGYQSDLAREIFLSLNARASGESENCAP
jgi:hypothetical protein